MRLSCGVGTGAGFCPIPLPDAEETGGDPRALAAREEFRTKEPSKSESLYKPVPALLEGLWGADGPALHGWELDELGPSFDIDSTLSPRGRPPIQEPSASINAAWDPDPDVSFCPDSGVKSMADVGIGVGGRST